MIRRSIFLVLSVVLLTIGLGGTTFADSNAYGSGDYGYCDYGMCYIQLTTTGNVSLNTTPTATGSCTVQSNTASVETDNTLGYTMTMTTSTTNNAMTAGSNSITASSGTSSAPTTLGINTWGYRVDGLASFGSGPTSAQTNGSTPSVTFAGVPASNGTPTAVASSSSSADPAVNTTVWYGLCANESTPPGTYSVQVTYTAVTN